MFLSCRIKEGQVSEKYEGGEGGWKTKKSTEDEKKKKKQPGLSYK